MNDILIRAYAVSNVGKVRQKNEDNYFLNNCTVNQGVDVCATLNSTKSAVMCICDGMGGEEAGEVASQLAVKAVGEAAFNILQSNCSDSSIENCIEKANRMVCNAISERGKRMGSTIAMLAYKDNIITAANVGDSRIYSYSGSTLTRISRDHTQAQILIETQMISQQAAEKSSAKHKLTQHLGIFSQEMVIEPYIVRMHSECEMRLLVCSDGLTDMLSDEDIGMVFSKKLTIDKCADTLKDIAVERGGKDNITVIVCEFVKAKEVPQISADENATMVLGTSESPSEKNIDERLADGEKTVELTHKKMTYIMCLILIAATAFVLILFLMNKDKSSNSVSNLLRNETTVTQNNFVS